MIGRTISHYQVVGKLGEGGMGVVYKARDTHLDRFVALKVLPPARVADPERKRRFVQEARAASALNHPNIVTIHDIAYEAGVDFIVMEFIAGKTLGQLIGRKGMSLDEALKCGVQIADALAAAHGAGIIHRDLKPGNVMVTDSGLVKVLDFGLAKLAEAPTHEFAVTQTLKPQTKEGALVGTVAYMSPEQAEGKPLDTRSDIFSFGSVLYELLTGRRAFTGKSFVYTLSEIIKEEPWPAGEIALGLPRDVVRILRQCMRKDPARRFQHISDVKVELEALIESPGLEAEPVRPRRRLWVALAASFGLLAGAVGAWWLLPSRREPPLLLRRLTFDTGLTTDPAISPDGRMVVYASDRDTNGNLDLWVQQIAGGSPLRLTQDLGDDYEPDFSPDGTRIVFRSDRAGGGAYVVPVLGGDAQIVAHNARHPRYSPDGSQIVYIAGGKFFQFPFVAPVSGGSPRQLSTMSTLDRPIWSPDGRQVMVLASSLDRASSFDAWIIPVSASSEGKSPITTGLTRAQRKAGLSTGGVRDWDKQGLILCLNQGDSRNVWRTTLQPGAFRADGRFTRLTTGGGLEEYARVARTGRMVFAEENLQIDLWRISLRSGDLQPLTRDEAVESLPSLSANGNLAAFVSGRFGQTDVWIKNLATGKDVPLTATAEEKYAAVISPTGRDVYFSMVRNGRRGIYRVPSTGGVPEQVADGELSPTDVSGDNRFVVLQYRVNAPRQSDVGTEQASLGVLDTRTGAKVENFLGPGYSLYRGHLSPDAQWLVFHAELASGETRVMIAPFRGTAAVPADQWFPVTDGKFFDDVPRWSNGGNSVLYLSDRDGSLCLWSQQLNAKTKKPEGDPVAVRHFHSRRFSPANVSVWDFDLAVGGESIVLNIGERAGNIWIADHAQ
jgi:Tol biopolymer transport system component/predicted Ser/Thr protein kinase